MLLSREDAPKSAPGWQVVDGGRWTEHSCRRVPVLSLTAAGSSWKTVGGKACRS